MFQTECKLYSEYMYSCTQAKLQLKLVLREIHMKFL